MSTSTIDAVIEFLDELDPGAPDVEPPLHDDETASPVDWGTFLPPSERVDRGAEDWEYYGDSWEAQLPPEWADRGPEHEHAEGVLGASCGESGRPGGTVTRAKSSPRAHACAWYLPLQMNRARWGIYIRESCVLDAALSVWWELGKPPLTPPLQRAIYRGGAFGLFLHEQFHHKVESLSLRLAIAGRAGLYGKYDANVYRKVLGTDDCLEEAIANADAYRRLKEPAYNRIGQSTVNATRRVMENGWRSAPPGYCIAGQFTSDRPYYGGLSRLQAQVAAGKPSPGRRDILAWSIRSGMHESLFPITSNIYVVYPVGGRPLMPLR